MKGLKTYFKMWGILVFPLNVLLTGHDMTILFKAVMLDAFCLISFKTIVSKI